MRLTVSMCILVLITWGTTAAAIGDANRCEAAKNKIAGKYAFCRQKAEAKAVETGDPADYSKCDTSFGTKWESAEARGGGMCPSNGDEAAIQTFITQHANGVAAALAGGALPDCSGALACGNATVDAGEDCDQDNLGGETCVTQGFAGGTLACGPGCHFNTSGCSATRFVDNGDGTVTDVQTGLMWEKKDDLGGIHDKDNFYTWSATGTVPDGTAFTFFLGILNYGTSIYGTTISGCFAHQCNWRLPTSAELQTILLTPFPCGTNPCIDPIFGTTQSSDFFWSATPDAVNPFKAWLVGFFDGSLFNGYATDFHYARAVRNVS